MTNEWFIKEAEKIKDPAEILNWYRNLYYKESMTTEQGTMARAINDILPEYIRQKAEIEMLNRDIEKMKIAMERFKTKFGPKWDYSYGYIKFNIDNFIKEMEED